MSDTVELVQIQCVRNGVTLNGWKLQGAIDPPDAEVLWLPEGQNPSVEGYEPYCMAYVPRGTRGRTGRGRWAVCYTCRYEASRSEMVWVKGHWYCTKHGCAEDMQ